MSFNNSTCDDDLELLSTQSQRSSTSVTRNQHLSLAQMRGVIQIFQHYFPKNAKRRLKKHEKQDRWKSYKKRIYREYGRVITGQLASEKALVKRYSEPLSFLKYKLKRATNLKITELAPLDQDYYYEIGGLNDVNELIRKTYNIDSLDKIQPLRKRPRYAIDDGNFMDVQNDVIKGISDHNTNHNNLSNKNRNNNSNQYINQSFKNSSNNDNSNSRDVGQRHVPIDISSIPPSVSQAPSLLSIKTEKSKHSKNIDTALRTLNTKMDVFEQEQLDKKKIEIYELTKQKILCFKRILENVLNNEPELIGFIPGIGTLIEQIESAFYYWLHVNKDIIKNKTEINVFMQQIITLKTDMIEWQEFLTKWKLLKIFHDNNSVIIWNEIKQNLNISISRIDDVQNVPTTNTNDKAEKDQQENEDIDL